MKKLIQTMRSIRARGFEPLGRDRAITEAVFLAAVFVFLLWETWRLVDYWLVRP